LSAAVEEGCAAAIPSRLDAIKSAVPGLEHQVTGGVIVLLALGIGHLVLDCHTVENGDVVVEAGLRTNRILSSQDFGLLLKTKDFLVGGQPQLRGI